MAASSQRVFHRLGGGLHQRAMEGRGHRQQHGALDAALLGDLHGPLDGRPGAREHDLPAAIVIGHLAHGAGRAPPRPPRFLAPRRARRRAAPPSRPRRREPPPASPSRADAASARYRRGSSAPAAQSAEYSPSEWPATNLASRDRSRPASFSSTRTAASETAISAGWALAVRVSSASGPLEDHAGYSDCASAASTSSNTARASRKLSASALPMPTVCDPCPGKMKAVDKAVPPDFIVLASGSRLPSWGRGCQVCPETWWGESGLMDGNKSPATSIRTRGISEAASSVFRMMTTAIAPSC